MADMEAGEVLSSPSVEFLPIPEQRLGQDIEITFVLRDEPDLKAWIGVFAQHENTASYAGFTYVSCTTVLGPHKRVAHISSTKLNQGMYLAKYLTTNSYRKTTIHAVSAPFEMTSGLQCVDDDDFDITLVQPEEEATGDLPTAVTQSLSIKSDAGGWTQLPAVHGQQQAEASVQVAVACAACVEKDAHIVRLETRVADLQAALWEADARAARVTTELTVTDELRVELDSTYQRLGEYQATQLALEDRLYSQTEVHASLVARLEAAEAARASISAMADALRADLKVSRRETEEVRALASARLADCEAVTRRLARVTTELEMERAARQTQAQAQTQREPSALVAGGAVTFDCPVCARRLSAASRRAQNEHIEACLSAPPGKHRCPVCRDEFPEHMFEQFAQHVDAHLS
eukprot:Opistho-2@65917